MTKGLDLIKRQQPEIIDGFPTGNNYIGVTKEELTELEKELKEHEQYKAIEKELGIDIPTYFKIRKAKKVYTKDELGRIDEKYLRDNIDGLSVFSEGFACIPECDQTLYISGYGKDWALNKEDLENE